MLRAARNPLFELGCGQAPALRCAHLGLTNRCNADCVHCMIAKSPPEELETEQIKQIIGELRDLGCFEIVFTGGEPFLRDDIFELLAFAQACRLGTKVLSNGTVLGPGKVQRLKRFPFLTVQVSLHGATAATHNAITRLPGAFEATLRGIQLLRNSGVRFTIASSVMKHNVHELAEMKKVARRNRWQTTYDFIIRPRSDSPIIEGRLSSADLALLRMKHLHPFLTAGGKLKTVRRAVRNPFDLSSLYIAPDRRVYPAAGFPLKLGELRPGMLRKIWLASEELNGLRRARLEDFECSRCCRHKTCCWDPGLAFAEHGHYTKKPKEFCRLLATDLR